MTQKQMMVENLKKNNSTKHKKKNLTFSQLVNFIPFPTKPILRVFTHSCARIKFVVKTTNITAKTVFIPQAIT